METIEERAELNLQYERDFCGYNLSDDMVRRAYVKGATEQKAIDDAQIKKLEAIVELTASVMEIGTKWFNDAAKMDATMDLREKIMAYYE